MLDALVTTYHAALADARSLRGALRLNRPTVLDREAAAHLADLEAANEGLARLHRRAPGERAAMLAEITSEVTAVRRRAAQGALHRAVRSVGDVVARVRTFTAACRADVGRSMPLALNYITSDGMVNLELFRLQLAATLRDASAAELMAMYAKAFERKAAPDVVTLEVIEHLTDTRQPLAVSTEDRQSAKALRELVDGARDLRVPSELPDVEHLAAELSRLNQRADLLRITPANPDQSPDVRAALEAEADAMSEAGAADDATDQAQLRELLAAGGGNGR